MKKDLAGGTLPSGDFGVTAAWWWMVTLALNLNQMMKHLAGSETGNGGEKNESHPLFNY